MCKRSPSQTTPNKKRKYAKHIYNNELCTTYTLRYTQHIKRRLRMYQRHRGIDTPLKFKFESTLVDSKQELAKWIEDMHEGATKENRSGCTNFFLRQPYSSSDQKNRSM
ncbi:hypothetical protein GOP47_0004545 [Adiantum capillus-veneris]|uniref:Uncharacterized protein n=1 Tax=Adiantum capillus-veneris TaxID=13818 RepID=A0A9D4V899_ADICA|nr:hypothetical protein GOP47_0004545 [Adiantum capillus-veneris]